jgi:hypothetical protein
MQMWQLVVRESVRQTLAEYTAATDRFDLRSLAACFSAEGVLEFSGGEQPLAGPAAIEAGLAAAMSRPGLRVRAAPTFVRHHVSSIRFGAVTADRVEVSSYFVVYTDSGPDHWGRYRDVLVPEGDRWAFVHRRIAVDAFAPGSLMAP